MGEWSEYFEDFPEEGPSYEENGPHVRPGFENVPIAKKSRDLHDLAELHLAERLVDRLVVQARIRAAADAASLRMTTDDESSTP
jgi:hypothetical protein